MNARTLRVLEWDKICQMLFDCAQSQTGKQTCLHLLPYNNLAEADLALSLTDDAEAQLFRLGSSPVADFPAVAVFAQKAERGGILSMRELLDVSRALRVARQVQSSLYPKDVKEPAMMQNRMTTLAQALLPQRTLEEDISRAIIGEDEMSDLASPKLHELRKKMRQLQEKVREKLASYLHNPDFQKYLQDALVTQRAGRFVLPVRMEHRAQVPGLVHDHSSSGATVFIEPMAVVELNNQMRDLTAEEREEIERILAEFSARVALVSSPLADNQEILTQLDFAFAKALCSKHMRASRPKLNDQGKLKLIKARHPLIDTDKVVPIDVWLGDAFTALVITGPNTGGKTVTLKTVGLLSIMASAGLHIPCDVGSSASVFHDIFADIGDEQSIEQSLSTFSSHMTNIVGLLDGASSTVLVLLDELGAGTDPAEGAALAMSILEYLVRKGAKTVATTHYRELKSFALTHQGVENASVEFDLQSLRPTYRLSIGIPGKSNAFAISKRLGLSDEIIGRAQDLLSAEDIRFEDVISSAESAKLLAEKERKIAEEMREETAKLRRETEALYTQMQEKKEEIFRKARDEAKQILLQTRAQSQKLLQEAQQAKNSANASLAARNAQKQVTDALIALGEEEVREEEAQVLSSVQIGQKVNILGTASQATVLSLPDHKGEVLLQAGTAKIKVPLKKLIAAKVTSKTVDRKTYRSLPDKTVSIGRQSCDLRGKTLDEAIMEVDKFLDESVISGLHEVMIVHGKGTGVLRSGIQQHLRKHPLVAGLRDGQYGEGDYGVTVVGLR